MRSKIRYLTTRLRERVAHLGRPVREFWRRLLHDDVYADAAGNLAHAAAGRWVRDPATAWLVQEAIRAVVGLIRASNRNRLQPQGLAWVTDPGWID